MPGKHDGRFTRKKICEKIGIKKERYEDFIRKLYKDGLSGIEISEFIERETGEKMTARSIQRVIQSYGEMRNLKEAFKKAMERGRVVWQTKEDEERRKCNRYQIDLGIRMKILERDEFKCVLCGKKEILQVEHKISLMDGGDDSEGNLRTLCIDCNIGNRILNGECRIGTGFKSGKIEFENFVKNF